MATVYKDSAILSAIHEAARQLGSAGRIPLPYPERVKDAFSSFSAWPDDGLCCRLRGLVDGTLVWQRTQTAIASASLMQNPNRARRVYYNN